jgi:VanZ family protein
MALKPLIPSILWASLILLAIGIPGSYIPQTGLIRFAHMDKMVHFGLFAVLGFLLCFGLNNQKREDLSRYYAVTTIILGVFYGAITEILQYLIISMRYGNFFDFIANAFGTIFGVLVYVFLGKSLIRKLMTNS